MQTLQKPTKASRSCLCVLDVVIEGTGITSSSRIVTTFKDLGICCKNLKPRVWLTFEEQF